MISQLPRGAGHKRPAAHIAAIISDTHLPRGRRRLPADCVRRLREADVIVHAGDVSTLAVLEELRALGPPVVAVRGNVDEAALRVSLPESTELAIGDVRIGVVHDAGRAQGRLERLRHRFPSCAAVVFGHSHVPLHERSGDFQIFNPGSPTDPRRQPHPTMGLARAAPGGVELQLVTLPR